MFYPSDSFTVRDLRVQQPELFDSENPGNHADLESSRIVQLIRQERDYAYQLRGPLRGHESAIALREARDDLAQGYIDAGLADDRKQALALTEVIKAQVGQMKEHGRLGGPSRG